MPPRARLTDARVVIGAVTALVLTALLGFQAGVSVPPTSRGYISLLSVGRSRCESSAVCMAGALSLDDAVHVALG